MKRVCIALTAGYGLLSAFLVYRWTGSAALAVGIAALLLPLLAALSAGGR